ncbi:HNH endonuclease [Geodermatophilus sp. YIM 151500]|uniref:HNH endonuclease signature motif containing protein n=1 Tax=Geodermatophilus sp. YIM 151500 TaxID=2984531 RepID=UPI0021E39DB3|nr:HNH endonuclease signature motif containing protein [Geodermatophilus sp. YIM 151500]MCV2487873.1 HNH endonuclease [Geodermatophilus sp. YIM 151500]
MFDGGGFGVGLAVAELRPVEWNVPAGYGPDALPAGVVARPSRLAEILPPAARSDAGIAAELGRLVELEARLAAYRVELIAELATRRPADLDPPPGTPGAASPASRSDGPAAPAGVSEFFADELALALSCSRTAATVAAGQALLLADALPATKAALADGTLDWPRARGIAEELRLATVHTTPGVLAGIEAAVLPTAADRSVRSLRAAVRAELLRSDAAAADARRAAAQRHDTDVRVEQLPDGMAELSAVLPLEAAQACREVLDTHARWVRDDGDERPLGTLRAAALCDLLLRPWDTSRPPVTAALTVLAPLDTLAAAAVAPDAAGGTGTGFFPAVRLASALGPAGLASDGGLAGWGYRVPEPARPGGQPITAAHLRTLLERIEALCPGGLQAPPGGTLHIGITDPATGELRAVLTRAQLQLLAARGCPAHPGTTGYDGPSPDGGEPVACRCPLVDRPPAVDRYRPSAAQRRFVTTRDRHCRHPGCANRAGWADIDHVVPHAEGGATDCANLCCLCRRHHRLKTHARGWTYTLTAEGLLTVTSPSGVTRTTRPPGWRHLPHAELDVPPDLGPAAAPARTAAAPVDDPPPF